MADAGDQVHGSGGAWVGGNWVDIDRCPSEFLLDGKAASDRCANCPRKDKCSKDVFDVAIIGAGCVGACLARELAKTQARVVVLEGADDVSQGATKGNSGIVHAGFDDVPGSRRAQFCPTGCRMFPQLDHELHFGFQRNGSLVVATTPVEEAKLEELLARGKTNGVANLRIIDRAELLKREPHINPAATKALLAEDAGTIVPYEFCIAVMENAVDNGVDLRLRHHVTGITKRAGKVGDRLVVSGVEWSTTPSFSAVRSLLTWGTAAAGLGLAVYKYTCWHAGVLFFVLVLLPGLIRAGWKKLSRGTSHSYTPSPGTTMGGAGKPFEIEALRVVNCAGCSADEIARMVGDESVELNPRLGEYILLDKKEGFRARATLFPCPGPLGKGVLVQRTLWGNLILGPTARDTKKKDTATGKLVHNEATESQTPASILSFILQRCFNLVPSIQGNELIHSFAGARAKSTRGDWIIEPSKQEPRLLHAAGIDSPGLAGSPAIALELLRLLKESGAPGVESQNADFVAERRPLIVPKRGMKDARGNKLTMGPVGKESDPARNVVCKCEKVTEAEVVDACRRSIPITSTQAVRKRTRAGMGHCQAEPGNYDCEARVAAIIARETKTTVGKIGRRPWPGSSLLPSRWPSKAEKAAIAASGAELR